MGFVAREIKRLAGKAIHRQKMIGDGDHVLVGVSGGKDSLALLWILRERFKADSPFPMESPPSMWIPVSVEIPRVKWRTFCHLMDLTTESLKVISVQEPMARKTGKTPAFSASRMRRKLLFELADTLGCNRIALGHHKDDIIETLFLNIFYGGSISTMLPVQELFGGKLTVIRPLYLLDEDLIRRYGERMDFPEFRLGCPSEGTTKREEIKDMLNGFYHRSRKVKGNIFHALQNVNPEYLL